MVSFSKKQTMLLLSGLILSSFTATNAHTSASPKPLTRNTQVLRRKKQKKCKNLDLITLRATDACKDFWLENGPSSSPTFSPRPSSIVTLNPSVQPSRKPSTQPSSIPSSDPTSNPSDQPSREPSIFPTALPSVSPTHSPTTSPSIHPSKVPSASPSKSPSAAPTVSHAPTFIGGVTIPLPQFNIALTFESNNARKLSINDKTQTLRDLNEELVDEQILYDALIAILSSAYDSKLTGFDALLLQLEYLEADTVIGSSVTQTTVKYWFSGSVILKTKANGRIDARDIPSEGDLQSETLQAFSSLDATIKDLIADATHSSYKSWVISKVDDIDIDTAANDNVTNVNAATGTMTITIAASVVALFSTLTAFGLIFKQSKANRSSEVQHLDTPTKKAGGPEEAISKARKFRSPFMSSSPPESGRKYFSKLDDESVQSKKIGKDIDPSQSMVDSSFDELSYASSLLAPSMSGSKLGGRSVDVESLAGMSALDNVRLNAVLQIEEDSVQDESITSNDTGSFRRIWYGSSTRKLKKEGSIKKLSPPSNDSPTKSSPKKSSPQSSVPISPLVSSSLKPEKEDFDDESLLGNQSNKGEYYGQNDDSNLFYNMLGDRSVASASSDDINFNDMYNGGSMVSSVAYSEQFSDSEKGSKM